MVDLGRIPGPLVIPAAVEIHILWQLANLKQSRNVFFANVLDSLVVDGTLAGSVDTNFQAAAEFATWRGRLDTHISYLGVAIRDVRSANLPEFRSGSAAVAGTNATGALPPEVAFVVTSRTNVAGRSGRGRTYLPGLAKDNIAGDGTAVAGVLTDSIAFLNAFANVCLTAGMTLGVGNPARQSYISPDTGRTIPARPAGVITILDFEARDNIFDSQRRRSQPQVADLVLGVVEAVNTPPLLQLTASAAAPTTIANPLSGSGHLTPFAVGRRAYGLLWAVAVAPAGAGRANRSIVVFEEQILSLALTFTITGGSQVVHQPVLTSDAQGFILFVNDLPDDVAYNILPGWTMDMAWLVIP